MANQNLSQFTEKTFVADADHTFIWDTAASISKRVSRNSWLNSGTLTSDAPVTISQTWNNAAVAFTGLKVNAAGTSGTNSAAASLLLDLQVGGVSKAYVDKEGAIYGTGTVSGGTFKSWMNASGYYQVDRTATGAIFGGYPGQFMVPASSFIGWNSAETVSGSVTTKLFQDAANTLALRNGANAQTFNVYGTYTSGTSYERLTLSAPSAANAIIGTNKGSGGGTARGLELQTDGVSRWSISTAGHLLTVADNTYDIGAGGANRPRNVYVGTSIVVGANDGLTGSITVGIGASRGIIFGNRGQIGAVADGVFGFVDFAGSSFSRLQLGPNSDAAPAIARDGAGIKFTGAAAGSTAWIKVPPVAVGSLPVAATAGAGARAFVNDASAPVFGSAVTGGGAVLVPVYCTGSAWNVG